MRIENKEHTEQTVLNSKQALCRGNSQQTIFPYAAGAVEGDILGGSTTPGVWNSPHDNGGFRKI